MRLLRLSFRLADPRQRQSGLQLRRDSRGSLQLVPSFSSRLNTSGASIAMDRDKKLKSLGGMAWMSFRTQMNQGQAAHKRAQRHERTKEACKLPTSVFVFHCAQQVCDVGVPSVGTVAAKTRNYFLSPIAPRLPALSRALRIHSACGLPEARIASRMTRASSARNRTPKTRPSANFGGNRGLPIFFFTVVMRVVVNGNDLTALYLYGLKSLF